MEGCIERHCTIEHDGKTFESGGSFLLPCTDGKWRGVVYGDWTVKEGYTKGVVGNWHGDIKALAQYGPIFHGNMGDKRRHIWFTWQGRNYHGVWCGLDWSQCIKVTSLR